MSGVINTFPVFGQESPGTGAGSNPRDMPRENLPRVVGPGILPDLMVMQNEKGEEILVPRTRYEDFEKILLETEFGEQGIGGNASINQLDLVIEPIADYAKVDVRGTVVLKKPNRVARTVAIGLGQLQWLPKVEKSDSGTDPIRPGVDTDKGQVPDGLESLATSSQSAGYLWRLAPGTSLQRRLELQSLCRLNTSSNGSSVRLDLPSTATVIRLRLPKGEWDLNALGNGSEVVEPIQQQQEGSLATIRTTANSITISWNRKANIGSLAAIEIRSQTKFTPTSIATQWRADSTVSIRGPMKLGGKRIRWLVPAESLSREPISGAINYPNYRLVREQASPALDLKEIPEVPSIEQSSTEEGSEKRFDAWQIEIDDSYNRTELDLSLEWLVKRTANESRMQFSPPIFEGVDRHAGGFEFLVPRNLSLNWNPTGKAQVLRQMQASDGSESILLSFQFEGQPASVITEWNSLADRPRIHAEQQLEVQGDNLLLRGSYHFANDPIQLPLLQLETEGWKAERIILYPSEVDVPVEALRVGEDKQNGVLSVPISANLWIKSASSTRIPNATDSVKSEKTGEVGGALSAANPLGFTIDFGEKSELATPWRLEVLYSRRNGRDQKEVGIQLPQLSWLSQETQQRIIRTVPGRLLVYSWNYRLKDDVNSLAGLIGIPVDRAIIRQFSGDSPGTSPYMLEYQISESGEAAQWRGERMRRASFVACDLEAQAIPSVETLDWKSRWKCDCLGSRPTALCIGLPLKENFQLTQPSFFIDGKECQFEWLEEDPRLDVAYRWAKVTVPEYKIDGTNRLDLLLEVHHSMKSASGDSPIDWAAIDWRLPRLISNQSEEQVVVDGARLRLLNGPSTRFKIDGADPTGVYEIDVDTLQWQGRVYPRNSDEVGEVQIEAEWVQTIFNALDQRDRYVARFRTESSQILIRIPDLVRRDAEWIIDGIPASVRDSGAKDSVLLLIPKSSQDVSAGSEYSKGSHVLEVFTTQRAPRGWVRKVQPIGPRVSNSDTSTTLIWQILVPRTEQLIQSSQNLIPLYRWRWSDLFLTRTGLTPQQSLEKRFGATRQPQLTQEVNQYDMTSFTSLSKLEAKFIPSALVWLPVSLGVLLLSLLLAEYRWMRWPWFWALFLGGFFVFSQIAWDVSLMILQAAIAAIGLSLIYGLSRWILDRRARRRSIFVSRQYTSASFGNQRVGDAALSSTVTARWNSEP